MNSIGQQFILLFGDCAEAYIGNSGVVAESLRMLAKEFGLDVI